MSDVPTYPNPSSPIPARNNNRPDNPRANFRLECKYVALTYPNCQELSFDELWTFITSTFQPKPDYVVLSRELHESGVPHYHALVYFSAGIRTRNSRLFDFGGRHPNVQSCRNPKNWHDYVRKDGDHRTFGTVPPKLEGTGGGDWGKCLVEATSRDDFLGRVKETSPRDYILFYDRICTFADQHFVKKEDYTGPDVDFVEPESLREWRRENLEEVGVFNHLCYSQVSLILVS